METGLGLSVDSSERSTKMCPLSFRVSSGSENSDKAGELCERFIAGTNHNPDWGSSFNRFRWDEKQRRLSAALIYHPPGGWAGG